MITAVTGDLGAGKTYYAVHKLVYKEWKSGRDIYSNTLLLFTDKFRRPGTNIVNNPDAFSRFEHLFFNTRMFLYPYFNNWFALDNHNYNPDDFYFWRRNRELIKFSLFNWFTYIPTRGNINYFSDITELIGLQDCLIFVDEGSAIFDARNWEMLPADFSNDLRQSRKQGKDLVVTTQEMGNIDINYRRVLMVWWECQLTKLRIWSNPIIAGFSVSKMQRVGDYTRTENANTENYNLQILKKKWNFITIFAKRKYDTNYLVGFNNLKIIYIERLCNFSNPKKIKFAIVPKKRTYKEVEANILKFSPQKKGR